MSGGGDDVCVCVWEGGEQALQLAIPSPCHFLILSFEGIFYSSSSNCLSVSPFLLLILFFFYDVPFILPWFPSGAVVLFYHAKFVEPGLHLSPPPLFLSSAFCITLRYFSLFL